MSETKSSSSDQLIRGGGQMGDLVRALDWASTPLGPIASWSLSLLTVVNNCLNSAFPMVVVWGPQRVAIYNDGYRAILGDKHPRALGQSYPQIWPEIWDQMAPMYTAAVNEAQTSWRENVKLMIQRRGFVEEAYFTFSISPLLDGARVGGAVGVVTETTGQVLSERRLETLRRLAQASADAPSALDACNAAADALAEEATDVPFSLFYRLDMDREQASLIASHGDAPEGWAPASVEAGDGAPWPIMQVLRTGEPAVVEGAPSSRPGDEGRPARGMVLPLVYSVSARRDIVLVAGLAEHLCFDDAYRHFLELVGGQVGNAIASAREREQAQRLADELYGLFMQAPEPICVLRGEELVFEMANPMYRQVVGGRELLGKTVLEALPEFEGQGFDDLLRKVMRTGEAHIDSEALLRLDRTGDGEVEDTHWTFIYAPLREPDGHIERVMAFCHDVTDQVRARQHSEQVNERLRESERKKDEFLAMLGHELRNPLAPIVTGLEIIKLQCPEGKVSAPVAAMDRQVTALERIVDDLLDVSRITRGKITLRPELVDVAEAVRGALDTVETYIARFDHEVNVQVEQAPLMVMGDPVRLEQILVNLLTNAAKYTERGGQIHVRVHGDADHARVVVRDNGHGMTEQMLEEIFELFTQAHQDIARGQGGLGIGLTVVRSLVEMHGGTIEAMSDGPGHGSEFHIRLPLSDNARVHDTPPSRPDAQRSALRVLLVDDNEDSCWLLSNVLAQHGYDVRTACEGVGALEIVDEWLPDVAILDLGLPGMSGYELARRLRDREQPVLRLVALTGFGQREDRQKSAAAGFDAHLVKPPRIDAILAALEPAN